MIRTPDELRASLALIEEDVALLCRVDALLASAVLELAGGHGPIMQTISRARRECERRCEQHLETKGVLRRGGAGSARDPRVGVGRDGRRPDA